MRNTPASKWILTVVYLASPAWATADYLLGWNVRTVFLDESSGWRMAYYGLMLALGLLMLWMPVLVGPLSVVEAGANVTATALALFIPYVRNIDRAMEMQPIEWPRYSILSIGVSILVVIIALSITLRQGDKKDAARNRQAI